MKLIMQQLLVSIFFFLIDSITSASSDSISSQIKRSLLGHYQPFMATVRSAATASNFFIHYNYKFLSNQFPRRLLVSSSLLRSIHSAHQTLKSSSEKDKEAPVANRRNIVEILKERSLLDSVTNEELLKSASVNSTLKVYCGFDPTAETLHLGNLLGIIVLSWFQRCGHTPVALIGGARNGMKPRRKW